jgi:hypothetical protein
MEVIQVSLRSEATFFGSVCPRIFCSPLLLFESTWQTLCTLSASDILEF